MCLLFYFPKLGLSCWLDFRQRFITKVSLQHQEYITKGKVNLNPKVNKAFLDQILHEHVETKQTVKTEVL